MINLFFLLLSSVFAGTLNVEILDVGQGDAILIQTPEGKVVLIDGGTGKKHDVVDYLKEREIDTINLLVASHPHADHIGGLDEVISAVEIKNYLDNGMTHTTKAYEKVMELIESKEISYIEARNGRQFNLDDGITLSIIHPQDKPLRNTRSDLNSNSVVIRLDHGENCFLFTGDAEEPTEHILVQKGIEQCDVLKVAHHGSNHSSTTRFLEAVDPEIALISLGEGNRYGHPGEESIRRIEAIGADIYRTDLHGTIHLQSDGKKIRVLKSSGGPTPPKRPSHHKSTSTEDTHTSNSDSKTEVGSSFDLNSASQLQLESIPGIGPVKATAIITYRETNGPFVNYSDLKSVKGIGDKLTLAISNHSYIDGE